MILNIDSRMFNFILLILCLFHSDRLLSSVDCTPLFSFGGVFLMSRSHALIGVLPFVVCAVSFMLVDTRRALRRALDTPQFDDETKSFQPHVHCDKMIDE